MNIARKVITTFALLAGLFTIIFISPKITSAEDSPFNLNKQEVSEDDPSSDISPLNGCIIEPITANIPSEEHDLYLWSHQSLYGDPPSANNCTCVAIDGNALWVGTSSGAIRCSLEDNTFELFAQVSKELGLSIAEMQELDRSGKLSTVVKHDQLSNWANNVVEKITILSPNTAWVDMLSGILLIRNHEQRVFENIEDALTAIYHTDLKTTLHKVAAVDRDGCLWLRYQYGETIPQQVFIRRYNGFTWETVPHPKILREAEGLVADNDGNIWICGHTGIFRWEHGQWKQSIAGFFTSFRRTSKGTVCAFGVGTIAQLNTQGWKVFKGAGRYEDFQIYPISSGKGKDLWETPDGRLWFSDSGDRLLMYDGNKVTAIPNITEVYAICLEGDMRLKVFGSGKWWEYNNDTWEMQPIPATTTVVNDIAIGPDGTLYTAFGNGLLQYKEGEWERLQFTGDAIEVQPVTAKKQATLQVENQATIPDEMKKSLYDTYLEGERKILANATDEHLADDIINGEYPSDMISYYRLLLRDHQLAAKTLEQHINSTIEKGLGKEHWITDMQLASFGTVAIEPLLKVVATGNAEERQIALGALIGLSNEHVANELLLMLNKNQTKDSDLYLSAALVAVVVGKPEGMDLFIKAATVESEEELLPNNEDLYSFRQSARSRLEQLTNEYADLPDDWSKKGWNDWWSAHRSTWKPSGEFSNMSQMAAGMDMMHSAWAEIAEKIEQEMKTK